MPVSRAALILAALLLAPLATGDPGAQAQQVPNPMAKDAANAQQPAARAAIVGRGWVESNQGLNAGYDWRACSGNAACGQFWSMAPATPEDALIPTLRLDRSSDYTNAPTSAVVPSLWLLSSTSPTGGYYEWPLLSQMYNQTTGEKAAQNVAINGTAFKRYKPGHTYGGAVTDQIGPTWGGNFVCNDQTATVNPAYGCVGVEIDNWVAPGGGTDANKSRMVLQLMAGTGGGSGAGAHVGTGLAIGTSSDVTMDTAINISTGSYGLGLDMRSAGVFSGGVAVLLSGLAQHSIGWTDVAGVYDATHGFNILAANDNNFYISNLSNTNIVFRGSGGAVRMTVAGDGVTIPTLPTSAGGGGLAVCVDTAGKFYKKATCP